MIIFILFIWKFKLDILININLFLIIVYSQIIKSKYATLLNLE